MEPFVSGDQVVEFRGVLDIDRDQMAGTGPVLDIEGPCSPEE